MNDPQNKAAAIVYVGVVGIQETINMIALEFPLDDRAQIEAFVKKCFQEAINSQSVAYNPTETARRYREQRH